MAEFLSPLWEFLFDAFGIFGIGIALGMVTFATVLLIVLIKIIVSFFKKLAKPKPKKQQRRPVSACAKTYTPSSAPSKPKAEPVQTKPVQPTKKSDYKAPSLEDFLVRAEKGEAFAQCCCGSMYEDKKDMEKAIYWFSKAGEQGHLLSNYRLGLIYLEGRGNVEQNLALAEKYLTYAAEYGFDSAQNKLVKFYSDKNKALCEEKGYTTREQMKADAQYNENYDKYKYWFKKSQL